MENELIDKVIKLFDSPCESQAIMYKELIKLITIPTKTTKFIFEFCILKHSLGIYYHPMIDDKGNPTLYAKFKFDINTIKSLYKYFEIKPKYDNLPNVKLMTLSIEELPIKWFKILYNDYLNDDNIWGVEPKLSLKDWLKKW